MKHMYMCMYMRAVYIVLCYIYCIARINHSVMRTVIHLRGSYDRWLYGLKRLTIFNPNLGSMRHVPRCLGG
jgi:hypothetical protein